MLAIIGKDVKLYSFPLGEHHRKGYDALVKRVCQVQSGRRRWTGCLVVGDNVLTSGVFPHDKEFDVSFYDGTETSGFLTGDWGDVIELGVGKHPTSPALFSQWNALREGDMMFSIGSFLGIPFTLAMCTVDKVICTHKIIDDERMNVLDRFSIGSPVFSQGGAYVGMLEAYVEKTDRFICRSFSANQQGILKG